MAQVSIVKKASVFAIVALSAVAAVSAQATAPAPSPDAGAAFSFPMSGVVIGSSMLLSFTNLGVRNLAYLCDMLNETGQLNIDVNEDTCTWSLGPNGTFTVKDARYRIDQNILPTLAHATTWDKSIPRKVNVFMWRLSLDRLPHRLNLSSRGMDIPAISCPSCNANVESANHVFFECDIATDMWKLVFRWCDIPLFQASSWDSFNDWIISWHASK
ncbi:RNA-directed DNA polymerase, eukaryota [Tanacetum coccineum]